MRRNWQQFIIALILFLPFTLSAQAAETYTLDPMHTYVLWHVSHFGFSDPSGKWMVEGTLMLDRANPQNSKVNAIIHVADIVTGIPELDKHLKGKLFFDVAQFPIATFVSNKVNVTGRSTGTVQGTLTLHGVSKPVTLQVMFNKIDVNPVNNKETAGFTASTTIKRSDFGINTLLPGVGDDVKLDIEAEAYKAA